MTWSVHCRLHFNEQEIITFSKWHQSF